MSQPQGWSVKTNPAPYSLIDPYVLRPHHLPICALIVILFKPPTSPVKAWSAKATLHVLRLVIEEVSELATPRSFSELLVDIRGDDAPRSDQFTIAETLRNYPNLFQKAGGFSELFEDLARLVVLNTDDLHTAPIERESYLGLFSRRCCVCHIKLSFTSACGLQADFLQWVKDPAAVERRDPFENVDDVRKSMVFSSTKDDDERIRVDSYGEFERSWALGDTAAATEHIHRYFDQRFFTEIAPGIHQYGLLHLARMHFALNHLSTCRNFLHEAIAVSRSAGDKDALEHCISLLRRLPKSPSEQPPETASPTSISPLDVLWEVQELLNKDESLTSCFAKVYQSIGAYDRLPRPEQANSKFFQKNDSKKNDEEAPFFQDAKDQFAQHCVQAQLWALAGRERLAAIEENIVIAFSEGGADDLKLNMICSKANRIARQGDIESALSLLLQVNSWHGLTRSQYQEWLSTVRNVTILERERRQTSSEHGRDDIVETNQLTVNQSNNAQMGMLQSVNKYLNELRNSRQYQNTGESAHALHVLLSMLWKTEMAGYFRLYRMAAVAFADLGLDCGMETESLKVMESILAQIINGDDVEERAYGALTYARTLIMTGKGDDSALIDALQYLQISEKDYARLKMRDALVDVKSYIIMIYDRLGRLEERDAAAISHVALLAQEVPEESFDLKAVHRLVEDIGIVLASGFD